MTTRSTTVHPPPETVSRANSFPPPPVKHTWRRGKKLTILPDPPRDPELMQQMPFITLAMYLIQDFHADQDDVLVGSDGYLCRSAETYPDRYVPDLIFARVDDPDTVVSIQNGYIIDEVGKPPDFVLEVASPRTGRADYTTKREGYARLGVVEYWRFDPSGGEYHDQPLAGDLLVYGVYQPIELRHEPDGSIWGRSAALGLDIYWQEGHLRFYDYENGEFLPEYSEVKRRFDAAMEERDAEVSRRRGAETRAESAETRAESAETQAASEAEARARAEAEVERLRERLRQLEK